MLVVVLIMAIVMAAMSSYAGAVNNDIAKGVIRLHVIANSDSPEDQSLKYSVRDSILEYMQENMDTVKDAPAMPEIKKTFLKNIENVANDEIKREGYPYKANVNYGFYPFPTKVYGDVAFPAGYYNAVRVQIGNALGHNWWCVMFPPLCMINTTNGRLPAKSKKMLANKMSSDDYKIITEDANSPNEIKVKFKIVEWFQSAKIEIKKLLG